jgi:steroid 5-alpha reductase family enzyme
MLKTILLLIFALLVLPAVVLFYDAPLSEPQMAMMTDMFYLMLGVAGLCFVVSEITRNCSQVDKLWSIMPIVYTWYFAYAGEWDTRMVLMAALATVWGLRLTFNFARRGGYSWIPWAGEEDYRWSVLRKNPLLAGRVQWALFNLFFISFYQQGLILMFTLPSVMAFQGEGQPLNWLDWAATALFLGLVVIETIADQQQYDYQTEKYRRIGAKEPLTGEYAKGFCATGLWAKVRHPNYAAEQAIWISFYLFSVAATGRWINGSMVGAVLLLLLFQGSADFSEKISAEKYPEYREYLRKVGRFFPKLF